MRGKGGVKVLSATERRITPAYAGKSQSKGNAACVRKDHPRLCGEKFTHLRAFFHFVGSPPPMRGKGGFPSPTILEPGITPAYAGKSSYFILSTYFEEDHPRLCGEKCVMTSF